MAAELEQGACGQFSGDDVLLELPKTRVIRDESDLATGILTITESELCWKSDDDLPEQLCLQYPYISVHAVSHDLAQFSSPCVFLLYQEEQEELDSDSDENNPCEIRLVPEDTAKLDDIYKAISKCQELYPDPELSSDSEQCDEGEELAVTGESNEEEGFYTSEEGLQHLTVDGQAVLAHLETILVTSNEEQTNGDAQLGQFEDADIEEQ